MSSEVTDAGVATGGGPTTVETPPARRRGGGRGAELRVALWFLLPALLLLGALVVYPIVATVVRSLFDRSGDGFVGLDNYADASGRSARGTCCATT